MEQRERSPLRLLAPVALIAFALALVAVISSSNVSEPPASATATEAEQADLGTTETAEAEEDSTTSRSDGDGGLPDDVYVVKSGDTLAAISEKVGISVEKLQELNPELDPQALVSGQKIKLRE